MVADVLFQFAARLQHLLYTRLVRLLVLRKAHQSISLKINETGVQTHCFQVVMEEMIKNGKI